MTCTRCRKRFNEDAAKCPHCGEPNPETSGVFQTSTVLISIGSGERVYRSVNEMPARLRTKLLRSTNGSNSATILIADRRGRKEVAKAMRSLPNVSQRRLVHSALAAHVSAGWAAWLTPLRRRAIFAALFFFALLLTGLLFGHYAL